METTAPFAVVNVLSTSKLAKVVKAQVIMKWDGTKAQKPIGMLESAVSTEWRIQGIVTGPLAKPFGSAQDAANALMEMQSPEAKLPREVVLERALRAIADGAATREHARELAAAALELI